MFCVVGGFLLHAQTPGDSRPQEEGSETRRIARPSEPWTDTVTADFYQTILDNNLFAPLGTVLNAKPKPGATLSLVATFCSQDDTHSMALIKDSATDRHHVLAIGGGIGVFTVRTIEKKRVTLNHHGNAAVVLHLPESMFLNTKR